MSMDFESWLPTVPNAFKRDALWNLKVYRLALYAADVGWQDISRLSKVIGMRGLSDQLYRSLGSIGANIAEGYSRYSPRDKARFYEYALGSARESRDWYYKSRFALDTDAITQRYDLLSQIIRLLITMIPQQRNKVSEDQADYNVDDYLVNE